MTRALPLLLSLILAVPVHAGALVVRTRGAQIDEAVAALTQGLGESTDLVVDESTTPDLVAKKAEAVAATVVIGVGARAAQLALKQSTAPVVHCMVLLDAASLDTDRSVGVPLALSAKAQLSALKRVVPKAKRIGLLYDPKLNARVADDAQAAARELGLSLVTRTVSASTNAPAAIDEIVGNIDALLLAPDATVVTKELVTFLVSRAFDKKLPVLAFSQSLVKVGVLAALAPSYAQNGQLCATLAKRVMAGEKPAALRGAVQMSGSLVINTATARRIGVDVPADVLRPPTELVGQ